MKRHARPRRVLAAALAGSLLFALPACSATSPATPTSSASTPEKTLTPDEARQSITDLYAATRNALGGSWVIDGKTWLDCSSAEGPDSAAFRLSAARVDQTLPGDPEEVVTRMQDLWSSRGIAAKIFFDKDISLYMLSYPRFGAGAEPDGYLVQLYVGDRYAGFSGAGSCVPGDSLELDLSEDGRVDE